MEESVSHKSYFVAITILFILFTASMLIMLYDAAMLSKYKNKINEDSKLIEDLRYSIDDWSVKCADLEDKYVTLQEENDKLACDIEELSSENEMGDKFCDIVTKAGEILETIIQGYGHDNK